MTIVTLGIDLAKNIFALHGVDQSGRKGLGSSLALTYLALFQPADGGIMHPMGPKRGQHRIAFLKDVHHLIALKLFEADPLSLLGAMFI